MNQHFLEKVQIASGFVPIAMGTGANTGDWVSMKNFGRLAIVFFAGAGTAGQDPTVTVLQATTNGGGSSKALNFTRVDVKQGTALTAIGQFTTNTQSAANTYTDATSAEVQKIWVIDIKAEDLDIDNGFDFVQASVADVGTNSQLGCILYIAHEPRESSATMPSILS